MGGGRNIRSTALLALILANTLFAQAVTASAGDIYDSQILQRMQFSSTQRPKVRSIIQKSDREMYAIFRKHGINPSAKPDFDKLQSASRELQAMETREKREMKKILTASQYKTYLKILQDTAARVIKATRQNP